MSQVQCPHCGTAVLYDANLAGQQVSCPDCNQIFFMQAPAAQPPAFPAIQTGPPVDTATSRHTTIYVDQSSQALPALCNFFMPGLGQLIQGRVGAAIGFFFGHIFVVMSIFVTFGIGFFWAVPFWIWCIVDAARYRPRRRY